MIYSPSSGVEYLHFASYVYRYVESTSVFAYAFDSCFISPLPSLSDAASSNRNNKFKRWLKSIIHS
jgi:hypothetical protein